MFAISSSDDDSSIMGARLAAAARRDGRVDIVIFVGVANSRLNQFRNQGKRTEQNALKDVGIKQRRVGRYEEMKKKVKIKDGYSHLAVATDTECDAQKLFR